MASRESTKWQQTLQSHYKGKGTVGYCWLVSGRFFTSNTDFLFMNKSSYKLNILDPDPSIKQISQPFVIPHHSFLFGIFFFFKHAAASINFVSDSQWLVRHKLSPRAHC